MIACDRLVSEFVEIIEDEQYVLRYRQNELARVQGWQARLSAYFWPSPKIGYEASARRLKPILADGRDIAKSLGTPHWDGNSALAWAECVFEWGGVRQNKPTADQTRLVLEAALHHRVDNGAPMNSGWTKVAAFATAHLELEN